MKKGLFVVGLIVVFLIGLNNYLQISSLKKKLEQLDQELPRNLEQEEPEDIELGDVMTKLQRHINKLWFAGQEANWPLSAFYVHELEETFEELTDHEVIDEGVNITDLAKSMGLKPLKMVEDAVQQKDAEAFQLSYDNLISHCNSCHQSSNHPFVVIKTPAIPVFDNQDYSPN